MSHATKRRCLVPMCDTPRRNRGYCYRHRHVNVDKTRSVCSDPKTSAPQSDRSALKMAVSVVRDLVKAAVVRSQASAIWQEGYPLSAFVVDPPRPECAANVKYLGVVKYLVLPNHARKIRRVCVMRGCTRHATKGPVGHKHLMEVRRGVAKDLVDHSWIEATCTRHQPLFAGRGQRGSDLHFLSVEHYVDDAVFSYLIKNGYVHREDSDRGHESGALVDPPNVAQK
jgi:hypothetical protein